MKHQTAHQLKVEDLFFRSLRKIILIYVEIWKTCMHILQHFGSSWCCVAEYKSKSMENLIPCALYFIRFSVTGICDQFLQVLRVKLDLKEMHIMLQERDNAWVIVAVLISGFGCYIQSYLRDALGYSLLMLTYIHNFDQGHIIPVSIFL